MSCGGSNNSKLQNIEEDKYTEPAIGRSLILSPFSAEFTWQTTSITEIIEHTDKYTHFKTQNSEYELFKF